MTMTNAIVGGGAVLSAAIFQILAGRDQKSLGLSSLQLLQEYSPLAVGILSGLVPFIEKVGWLQAQRTPETLMGFPYTLQIVTAICFSASCGLMVILSSFLVIGSTSALIYNVVGHSKTVIILAGGALLFNDHFSVQKLLGVAVALAGIVWYSLIGLLSPVTNEKAISVMAAHAVRKPSAEKLPGSPSLA